MTRLLVIPDTQCKTGHDFEFLRCFGELIVDEKPDGIVHIGDHWDMESLSSYDVGKKSAELKRYRADIQAGKDGMTALLSPLREYNLKMRSQKKSIYRPRMDFHMGNHENRVNRAINDTPMLDGTITTDDMDIESFGWTVHPFLKVNVIEGVAFSHYFCSGKMGQPCSTAQAQLKKKYMSTVAGHQQGFQLATDFRADGKTVTAIIAGSSYPHDEAYLNHQTNKHWRGIFMMNNVKDGEFTVTQYDTFELMEKYKKAA